MGGPYGTAHPFASLKLLQGMVGASTKLDLPISNGTTTFTVNPSLFVASTYPVSTTAPTKVTSSSTTSTVTTREVEGWICALYSIILVFFFVLAGGFIYTMRKEKEAQTAKANHVLYDNLNPTGEQRSEGD